MRTCWQCGDGLILCNGFVGGDLAALMRGEEPKITIRETCNKCVIKYQFDVASGLPKPFLLPSEKTP